MTQSANMGGDTSRANDGPFTGRRVDALVVNAGSTSVKLTRILGGKEQPAPANLDDALAAPDAPAVVVHRVVHGGDRTDAVVLDTDIIRELRALTDLAPLHQPPALDAIDRCRHRWPGATQIACFDTAFHTTMPDAARTYALPERLRAKVRVYGFHGLSFAWSAKQLGEVLPGAGRVLIAHLGGGQSLCGLRDGRSVVTTMGFTPLDGLAMATRSGAVDPGAVLWLASHTDEDLQRVFEQESGLFGLAGSGDMHQITERADRGDTDASAALQVWLHRFLVAAGGCVAVLGGLDALVFTGGIGENSSSVRRLVADRLGWLGVAVEDGVRPDASDPHPSDISTADAPVRTFVVHAREDLQMVDEAAPLVRARDVN